MKKMCYISTIPSITLHPVNTQSKNENHDNLHFRDLNSPPLIPSPNQSPPNKIFTINTSITPPPSPPLTTSKYNNALLVIHFRALKYVHLTKDPSLYSPNISQTTLANQIIDWLTSKSHMKYLLSSIPLKDPFKYSVLRKK